MTNKFTAIIVDDEPQAISLLMQRLQILNANIDVIGIYVSWKDALEALRSQECDILFLDISIQGKNGMDLLKAVPNMQSEVIFITAHSEYALSAFKFAATGYILKPIDDIDLAKAIDKATERVLIKRQAKKGIAPTNIMHQKIGIPNNNAIDYVSTEDIIYLQAENTYTHVVTKNREIVSSYNLGKFKELLNEKLFFQVHRSFIINLNCIRRYESSGMVIMENNMEIPVSKSSREDFLNLFSRVRYDG